VINSLIEFPEDIATAIRHLKTTLPLLTRDKLAPNPINYGVYYLYASNRSGELRRQLDSLQINGATASEQQLLSLFRQYLLEEHGAEQHRATGHLNLLAQGVQAALQDSIRCANDMDRRLGESRNQVCAARDSSDIDRAIVELLRSIEALSDCNRDYRRIVQGADAEIDRLRTELNRLQRASDIDDLTQLYNRSALLRQLGRLINDHRNDPQPLSLIMMDIDFFKSINDRYGHLMGDRVLQRIGSVLLQQLRADTIAARFGGEEFVILCRETDLASAAMLAERLRDQLQRLRIRMRNSDATLDNITASFGVAAFRADDTIDSLLDRADRALYAAKHKGRNRVELESA
jgi:diguanylate cyclase